MSNLYSDKDIKIAGDKPSRDIEKNKKHIAQKTVSDSAAQAARELGEIIALKFIEDSHEFSNTDDVTDFEMIIQRRLLLSFTATVGFELYCGDDTACGIAQKSFIDELKKREPEIYKTSSDTGAFSFYYLAFRRGSEIERRMGQTFAMLCSHDGDPVYQELGEALYCWFLAAIRKTAKELGLIN